MLDNTIGVVIAAALIAGVIYAVMRLRARYVRKSGRKSVGGRQTRGDQYALDFAAQVVGAGVNAVLVRFRNGVPLPTQVEVGVSDDDYELARKRAGSLQRGFRNRLREAGVTAAVRLVVREAPEVRRGAAIVIATSTEKATEILGGHGSHLAPPLVKRSAWLVVGGNRHPLVDGVTIGRQRSCDIRLTSKHASGRHATISASTDGWYVTDHSSNGTWVQGVRVDRESTQQLTDGAALRFADADCLFEVT